MNETKKPAVRFKGFSDEWEQQKFNDILEKYEDPVATPHDGYERLGVRSHAKGTFHSYVAPGAELEAAQMHRVAANKMLFNITFAWEHAVAITDEIDAGKLVSHRFPQFSFNTEMSPKFFKYVIIDEKFRYHLWLSSPGGAGRNRVLNIPEMLKYQTYLPEKSEQDMLADWFINLDEWIEQHQAKLEKLKTLKVAMLEKMFPKDGADVPEVRFKEFTGGWSKCELGQLCEKFTDGDWIESKDQSNSGIRLIQTGNIGIAEYLDKPKSKKWISNETFERLHCEEVFPGDILISRLPEPAGRACIVPDIGVRMITAVDCTIVRTNSGVSNKFLVQYLSSQRYFDKVNAVLAGGTRQRISRSNLSSLSILIPKDFKEQEAIGNYFTHLNTVITLQQQKLDKLQSIKKALLEKMFV